MANPDVLVPGWLAELGQDEAQKLCAFYARQCLADATTARCNGRGRRPADPQDAGSWYAAARRWLALHSALGVSVPVGMTAPKGEAGEMEAAKGDERG